MSEQGKYKKLIDEVAQAKKEQIDAHQASVAKQQAEMKASINAGKDWWESGPAVELAQVEQEVDVHVNIEDSSSTPGVFSKTITVSKSQYMRSNFSYKILCINGKVSVYRAATVQQSGSRRQSAVFAGASKSLEMTDWSGSIDDESYAGKLISFIVKAAL